MRAPFVIIAALAVVLSAVAFSTTRAESEPRVRVIVNAANPSTKVSKQFIADAFLKKRSRWGHDTTIQPVDLGKKDPVRARFSKRYLDRDVSAVRRYWAQLVFSGKGVPPPEVANEAAVIEYVAKHKGAIGYVSTAVSHESVKVVSIE